MYTLYIHCIHSSRKIINAGYYAQNGKSISSIYDIYQWGKVLHGKHACYFVFDLR